MMILTLTALFLSLTALVIGTFALFAARRTSAHALAARLNEQSLRFSELETALESIQGRLKSMAVQIRNKERAKSPNNGDQVPTSATTESEKDEWQRKMNQKLHAQKFRTPDYF